MHVFHYKVKLAKCGADNMAQSLKYVLWPITEKAG